MRKTQLYSNRGEKEVAKDRIQKKELEEKYDTETICPGKTEEE